MSLFKAKLKSLKDQHREELSNEDLKEETETLKEDSYFCEECGRNHRTDSGIGKEHLKHKK